ncbi:MAG TPA: hypothetical protein PLP99_10105 [Ignavibacteriales bacterium]|nr:hypothetical protein [Ignavibacteriales bacterium]HOL82089.1 hypothetical protein [Ignavibacteriales bacterium]HPP34311.1 hypothetical protein [Ignavibacteriales bacterium]
MNFFVYIFNVCLIILSSKNKAVNKKITEAELIGILEKNLEDKNYNQLLSNTLLLKKNYPNSVAIPYFLGMYYYNTKIQLDSDEYFLKLSVGNKYQMFNSLLALTLLAFNDLKDYNKTYEYTGNASNLKTLFGDTNTIKRSEVCFIAGYISEYFYKNFDKAKLWYYWAYKDNPNNTYTIYNLALLNYKTKNLDLADEYFKILLTKNHNLN